MKIMKILEIHMQIKKIIKILKIYLENHWNPYKNYKIMKINLKIHMEIMKIIKILEIHIRIKWKSWKLLKSMWDIENHWKHRNPLENYKKYENYRSQNENNEIHWTILEINVIITKIMKIINNQNVNHEKHENQWYP